MMLAIDAAVVALVFAVGVVIVEARIRHRRALESLLRRRIARDYPVELDLDRGVERLRKIRG